MGAVWGGGGGDTVGTLTSFDPNWSTVGGANTIGNGTITASYSRLGSSTPSLVFIAIEIVWGSTTSTFDSQPWRLDLPFAKNGNWPTALSAHVLDSGTDNKVAVATFTDSDTISIHPEGGNEVTDGVPMAWASGDSLKVSGFYYA